MAGRIYKIYSTSDPRRVYIGSTYKTLERRLRAHKRAAFAGVNYKFYQFVREVGAETLVIEQLLIVPQVSKKILRELEGHFCRLYKATDELGLNMYVPGRTAREYREDNKERSRACWAGYYAANRDREMQPTGIGKQKKKEIIICSNGAVIDGVAYPTIDVPDFD